MNWNVILLVIGIGYLAGWLFAPFPHWPTYFLLLRHILLKPEPSIPWRSRLRQCLFLLPYPILAPLWTALWYLDEFLFPAYRQGQHRSVFIIGQPRSGTTFLHRTLATDEETFFAIRHIEWRYPFISVQKLLQWLQWEERLNAQNYWPDTETGRKAAKMHTNTLYDWEEDAIFFEERFLHHLFVWLRVPFPELIPALDDFTLLPEDVQHHMLKSYQKVVQKVLYLRGAGKVYLSKEVAGQRKLHKLIEYYPDATFLLSTRPSSLYLSSIVELARLSTTVKTGVDPTTIPGWEAAFIERMRGDCPVLLDFLAQTPPEKQIHLAHELLVEQIVPSIQAIYTALQLPFSAHYQQVLDVLQKQQQQRDRDYTYPLQTVQGFADYDAFVAETYQTHQQLLASSEFRPMPATAVLEPSGS